MDSKMPVVRVSILSDVFDDVFYWDLFQKLGSLVNQFFKFVVGQLLFIGFFQPRMSTCVP